MQRLADFKARSKVVVLLTDGESNVHDIDEDTAIEDAVKAGIKVYTIGAGTTGVAPIRVDRGDGRSELMQMPVSIDETTLRKIADKTGGQYFRATDNASLDRIYVPAARIRDYVLLLDYGNVGTPKAHADAVLYDIQIYSIAYC